MDFLFDKQSQQHGSDYKSEMRGGGEALMLQASGMSHGEQLLLQAAISIWNGQVRVSLEELISVLDNKNLNSLIQALLG